ncbi:MAG TPA: hypothetical protein VN823_18115 [Stellaceae bacterium]|nr:hypothetical protein [Stellaceae bacterium]
MPVYPSSTRRTSAALTALEAPQRVPGATPQLAVAIRAATGFAAA